MALRGEVPGVGEVQLGWLFGQPFSVVLLRRDEAAAATPVGDALNRVMVEHGGRRVSVLALPEVPAATRPVARRLVGAYRSRVLAEVRGQYAALGRSPPADLERTAWLVADWDGSWQARLAPECPGLAVAFFDAKLRRVDLHCAPSAAAAAARFAALVQTGR
jgi:hypothetical protein